MMAEDRKVYSSRFTVLTDADGIANAKKNYLIWLLTGSVLFCILAGYFYYKIILTPAHYHEQSTILTEASVATADSTPKQSEFKLFNPKPLLSRFSKQNSKTQTEFICEESQPRLPAIPPIFIEEIFRNDFQDIHDYIGLDLLLHYDKIINEFRPNYLKSIFNEYQSEWLSVRNSRDFLKLLEILNSNNFKFYADYLKHQKVDFGIKRYQSYFALTEELNQWYNYLDRLGRFLLGYEQQKSRKYFEKCTENNFRKYTEETQKLVFRFVYPFNITEKKLEEVNEVIQECGSSVKVELYNSAVVFYNRVVLLSQINRELIKLDKSRLKSVYIFASYGMYLDEDVELFGVNLVIITPRWVFMKKVRINLNGLRGGDITETASPNEAGKPGNPGGNAGDFLGIGNLQEKFLLISAQGGDGGKGQNGAKGRDGVNGSFPAPPVDKPSSCNVKINSFNNAFGERITHYEIYSEEGCGGPGTDGGVGGMGGKGGVITLITKEGVKVRRELSGIVGLPGKGGPGGVGGRSGCFYEALDTDDEVLRRVSRVKCPMRNVLPDGEHGKDNYNTRGRIFPTAKDNVKVSNSLSQFVRVAREGFNKHIDADVIPFLKELNQHIAAQYQDVTDLLSEYKSIKDVNKIEFFDMFEEKVIKFMQEPHNSTTELILKYLKSITLGEMTLLKENINYFFIDFKNYVNLLKNNIKNINENKRDFQAIAYLKQKVGIKRGMIAENLKEIKLTALGMGDRDKDANNFPEEKRKFLCVTITTIEMLYTLVNSTAKGLKTFESDGLLEYCSGMTTKTEKGRNFPVNITKEERNVFKALENLASNDKHEIRGQHLVEVKGALCAMEQFSDGGRNLLQALTDELEHFIALYDFIEWEEMGNLFFKSLGSLTEGLGSTGDEEIKFLKSRLVDVMIGLPYKLAMDATRQNLNHFINLQSRANLQKNTTADDVLNQLTLLQDLIDQDMDSYCKNHLKAVFDKDSAVGEFYFWPNEEVQTELRNLFSGAEINLKSNLINRHVFDKNYVQFTSIKLEFECIRNRIAYEKQIHEVLSNFKIEITHSGYSYYNWKGETQIVVSEKVGLEYSFRTRDNGKPEVYNALFKKCQVRVGKHLYCIHDSKPYTWHSFYLADGEIKLSPFTTWSIRLLPINDDADFNKLSTFAQVVNLRLTGTGTYIS